MTNREIIELLEGDIELYRLAWIEMEGSEVGFEEWLHKQNGGRR